MGPLGHWGFLFTKLKCFSLQSTKQSEYHSQPGSHLKASTGILQSNVICTSVVHTSAAPWIKEQEIVCSCNIRFPVANPGNIPPQLKFSFKTLYCPSVRVLVYTLPFKIQPPDLKLHHLTQFMISHGPWCATHTRHAHPHRLWTPRSAASCKKWSRAVKLSFHGTSMDPHPIMDFSQLQRGCCSLFRQVIGVTQCMATIWVSMCWRTSLWLVFLCDNSYLQHVYFLLQPWASSGQGCTRVQHLLNAQVTEMCVCTLLLDFLLLTPAQAGGVWGWVWFPSASWNVSRWMCWWWLP